MRYHSALLVVVCFQFVACWILIDDWADFWVCVRMSNLFFSHDLWRSCLIPVIFDLFHKYLTLSNFWFVVRTGSQVNIRHLTRSNPQVRTDLLGCCWIRRSDLEQRLADRSVRLNNNHNSHGLVEHGDKHFHLLPPIWEINRKRSSKWYWRYHRNTEGAAKNYTPLYVLNSGTNTITMVQLHRISNK